MPNPYADGWQWDNLTHPAPYPHGWQWDTHADPTPYNDGWQWDSSSKPNAPAPRGTNNSNQSNDDPNGAPSAQPNWGHEPTFGASPSASFQHDMGNSNEDSSEGPAGFLPKVSTENAAHSGGRRPAVGPLDDDEPTVPGISSTRAEKTYWLRDGVGPGHQDFTPRENHPLLDRAVPAPTGDIAATPMAAWTNARSRHRMSIGAVLAAAGAAGVVAGSFAPFVVYDGRLPSSWSGASMFGNDDSFSAWSGETFMFPLSVLPVALAFVVIAAVTVGALSGKWPTSPSGGHARHGGRTSFIGSPPTMITAAGTAMAVMLGYALSNKNVFFGSASNAWLDALFAGMSLNFGAGGITMLLASIVMTSGAVAHLLGLGPELVRTVD